ncbi:MAG: alpha/beta hydrolase [Spirochaetales bacterium]|nr:alpha/beta hydrolase [Spirochaetales bacterium]
MMSFDEKMKLAERMRNSNRFKPVEKDEFDKYNVTEEKRVFSGREGETVVYVISPDDISSPSPVVINLHGGGFINKRLDRDRLFCFKIAEALKCVVIDVDYKLSPEYVFPAALNECEDIIYRVNAEADRLGIDRSQISLTGHSAGGNLAVSAVATLLKKNLPAVSKMVIEYAPLDMFKDPADKPSYERDLPAERARGYNSFYCKEEELKEPRVSPTYMEEKMLKDFPDTLVITAGEDRLNEEGLAFAEKLKNAGVKVCSKNFDGCVHGFTINRMDRHEESFKMIIDFLA